MTGPEIRHNRHPDSTIGSSLDSWMLSGSGCVGLAGRRSDRSHLPIGNTSTTRKFRCCAGRPDQGRTNCRNCENMVNRVEDFCRFSTSQTRPMLRQPQCFPGPAYENALHQNAQASGSTAHRHSHCHPKMNCGWKHRGQPITTSLCPANRWSSTSP